MGFHSTDRSKFPERYPLSDRVVYRAFTVGSITPRFSGSFAAPMVTDGSLSLLTDLYQLTMAAGYWASGLAERETVFHVHFRKRPFAGGYAIAAGLGPAIEWLESLRFTTDDRDYLSTLRGNDNKPLFSKGFLDYLSTLHFTCDVDAVTEGTAVFALEPLLRIKGPLLQCQLAETALLNILNFQTLVATKSARVCSAAGEDPVLEFGLRRAQGTDGGLSASRAAYIGGVAGTSNVLAGKQFGIPVKGTHAHAWVMAFDTELEAFRTYAEALPNNCVFLVDTYDTLDGVRHAIEVGKTLKTKGHKLAGVRLDSGDLAWLSQRSRELLDAEGFSDTVIIASNDLDEKLIASLKTQGARIDVWGVGTKLATAYDQPALGGVYKLSAMRETDGAWQHRIKLSEQTAKISIPGMHQVRRFSAPDGTFIADMLWDELSTPNPDPTATMVDPLSPHRRRRLDENTPHHDLLVPVFRHGKKVYTPPPLADSRAHTLSQLAALDSTVKRFENPHEYPVGLEATLHALRERLITEARGETL